MCLGPIQRGLEFYFLVGQLLSQFTQFVAALGDLGHLVIQFGLALGQIVQFAFQYPDGLRQFDFCRHGG